MSVDPEGRGYAFLAVRMKQIDRAGVAIGGRGFERVGGEQGGKRDDRRAGLAAQDARDMEARLEFCQVPSRSNRPAHAHASEPEHIVNAQFAPHSLHQPAPKSHAPEVLPPLPKKALFP